DQLRLKYAARVEDVDVAEALAVDLVAAASLTLREGHVNAAIQDRDIERRESLGQVRIGEAADRRECRVENLHLVVGEIRRQQMLVHGIERKTLVDRALIRPVVADNGIVGVDRRYPA